MIARVLAARVLLGATFLSAIAHGGAAHAEGTDKAAADALFQEAQQLMFAERFAEACPKLAESQRLDPGIGTMLYLGDCWAKTGRTASALAQFRAAESLAAKRGDKRKSVAADRADPLEARVPRLTIALPHSSEEERRAASGYDVRCDGERVDRALLEKGVPVDPGTHVVTASAPGKKPWETHVVVVALGAVTVPTLEADNVSVPGTSSGIALTPPPPAIAGQTQRLAALGVLTLGVATVALGSVLGVNAKSIYDASNADNHCAGGCDAYGTDRRHQGFETARISTVALIAGAAAIGAGAVIYLTAPQNPQMQVGLGAAALPGGAKAGAVVRW